MILLADKIISVSKYLGMTETCDGTRIIFDNRAIDHLKRHYHLTSLEAARAMTDVIQSTEPKKLLGNIQTIEQAIEASKCIAYCEKYIYEYLPSATIVGHDISSSKKNISISTLLKKRRGDAV